MDMAWRASWACSYGACEHRGSLLRGRGAAPYRPGAVTVGNEMDSSRPTRRPRGLGPAAAGAGRGVDRLGLCRLVGTGTRAPPGTGARLLLVAWRHDPRRGLRQAHQSHRCVQGESYKLPSGSSMARSRWPRRWVAARRRSSQRELRGHHAARPGAGDHRSRGTSPAAPAQLQPAESWSAGYVDAFREARRSASHPTWIAWRARASCSRTSWRQGSAASKACRRS